MCEVKVLYLARMIKLDNQLWATAIKKKKTVPWLSSSRSSGGGKGTRGFYPDTYHMFEPNRPQKANTWRVHSNFDPSQRGENTLCPARDKNKRHAYRIWGGGEGEYLAFVIPDLIYRYEGERKQGYEILRGTIVNRTYGIHKKPYI